ncbi:MAG: betaine-aldehyde dehydrogenase [Rhizobiaceae bacterium]|nr:betaine-aldehyde dehydrogenase [Rhizobiaceae bacterium]
MVFGDADIENAVGGAMACRLAFSQGDLACAHQMFAELQAGTCRINSYNLHPGRGAVRRLQAFGLAAPDHYSQLKSVYVETGDVVSPC